MLPCSSPRPVSVAHTPPIIRRHSVDPPKVRPRNLRPRQLNEPPVVVRNPVQPLPAVRLSLVSQCPPPPLPRPNFIQQIVLTAPAPHFRKQILPPLRRPKNKLPRCARRIHPIPPVRLRHTNRSRRVTRKEVLFPPFRIPHNQRRKPECRLIRLPHLILPIVLPSISRPKFPPGLCVLSRPAVVDPFEFKWRCPKNPNVCHIPQQTSPHHIHRIRTRSVTTVARIVPRIPTTRRILGIKAATKRSRENATKED
jgi:hypothetical protein